MKAVVTSLATTSSTPWSTAGEPTASNAPSPPSVVAEPPQPITMRRAPASRAASRSCPTPAVPARTGSSPCGFGRRSRPAARDISTTAVGAAVAPAPSSMRHSASTGAPSGPATVVTCFVPPSASSRPSPPSDMGTSSAVHPAARAASAMADATSAALAVPRNLSGAATRWGTRVDATERPRPAGPVSLRPMPTWRGAARRLRGAPLPVPGAAQWRGLSRQSAQDVLDLVYELILAREPDATGPRASSRACGTAPSRPRSWRRWRSRRGSGGR